MQPSWSIPIPQAMQQHGGSQSRKPAPPDPKQTSARQDVAAPANEPEVEPRP
jgi:hypothetical protein